jgi:carbamoyltransferase
MLLVAQLKPAFCNNLPEDLENASLWEKLYYDRSIFQPICHIDHSARIHTVDRERNERYWNLLQKVKEQSGHAILVNTSFNVRGEPIVCTARDAYRCFMNTEMDVLVIDRWIFYKNEQARYDDRAFWKQHFNKD